MGGADDVLMRIVIQDDGRTSPPEQNRSAPATGDTSPAQAAPKPTPPQPVGSATMFANQPAGVAAKAQQTSTAARASAKPAASTADPETLAAAGSATKPAALTNDSEPSSAMDEVLRMIGRQVGVDLAAIKAFRDAMKPAPAAAPPEVKPAPPLVTVNEPKQAGAAPYVVGGQPGIKINAPDPGLARGELGGIPNKPVGLQSIGAAAGATPPPPPPSPPPAAPAGNAAGTGGGKPPGGFGNIVGAAAGGSGSLAGAIGIAGAAIAIHALVDNFSGKIGENARSKIATGVGLAKDIANNDPVGAFTKGIDEAADAVGKFAPVSRELLKTNSAMVKAFDQTTKAFIERGRELARFSPQIAGAVARQNVREIRSDIREADRLGPSYARVQDKYGELMAMLKEILLPLKEFILDGLGGFLEIVRDFISVVKPIIIGAEKLFIKTIEFFASINPIISTIKFIGDVAKLARKILEKFGYKLDKEEEGQYDLLTQLKELQQWNAMHPVTRNPNDRIRDAADRRMFMPAFAGM